ncbi:hypothetical protein BSZ35_19200 [Salinibacter sp. 10B]|uniref:relaxase/mobilization nuclease domain-containing protein n=1 Tax=Salinibacter sp. 10B TaxID=1923971 RepID=UPI000CF3F946|nr:hypothetical protein [Salinibacter sp. 10B]PQJ26719.1 hypothetical protein BSZ35_19200 [Salinibacter sp. 10B]
MIIKGGSRSNGAQLGRYLMQTGENIEVKVLELPSSARSVEEAIRDMERMGKATRGEKVLYHAQINPNPGEPMWRGDWIRSADILAEKLGMEGQPRVIVFHLKEGYLEGAREHAHVVFQRTDVREENLGCRLISDSHNYRKHEAASRQIERELGHEPVPTVDRGTSYTQEEARKASQLPAPTELVRREGSAHTDSAHITYVPDGQYGPYRSRRGANPKEVRAFVTTAYQRARGPEEFRDYLWAAKLQIAIGERRAYSLIDEFGNDYTLARMVQGARTSDLKRFLGPVQEELYGQEHVQELRRIVVRFGNQEAFGGPELLSTTRFEPGGDLYRDPRHELENMDPEERAELERVLFGERGPLEQGPEQEIPEKEIPEKEKSKQESPEPERSARGPETEAAGRGAPQESRQEERSREVPEEGTPSLDPSREERLKEEIRRRALKILDENTPPEEKRGRSRGEETDGEDPDRGEKPEKDQEKGRDKGRGKKSRGRGRSGGMGLGF